MRGGNRYPSRTNRGILRSLTLPLNDSRECGRGRVALSSVILAQRGEKTKLENAIQLALRDAKAVDPDYLAFKLREKYKPEELTLDENGKVKGMDDKLAASTNESSRPFLRRL